VFIIYELVGEPGAASHASVGVIDAIHLPLSFEHAIPAAVGLTIGPKSHMTCFPRLTACDLRLADLLKN